MKKKIRGVILGAMFLIPGALVAQDDTSVAINVRGGIMVPTFDVTDVADAGPGFGFGIAVPVSEQLFVRGNVDFGSHDGAGPVAGGDVQVNHFIGGIGYELVEPTEDSPIRVSVNAGAGLLTFDVETAEGVTVIDNQSYFAINVGGELEYVLSPNVSLLLSPQGDIAFVDEDDGFTGSTAWVWPFTAGAKIRI